MYIGTKWCAAAGQLGSVRVCVRVRVRRRVGVRVFVERVFGLVFVCSGLRCGDERVFGCVPVFAVFGRCFTVVFGSVRFHSLIM